MVVELVVGGIVTLCAIYKYIDLNFRVKSIEMILQSNKVIDMPESELSDLPDGINNKLNRQLAKEPIAIDKTYFG